MKEIYLKKYSKFLNLYWKTKNVRFFKLSSAYGRMWEVLQYGKPYSI